jgi:hypothetical protein
MAKFRVILINEDRIENQFSSLSTLPGARLEKCGTPPGTQYFSAIMTILKTAAMLRLH